MENKKTEKINSQTKLIYEQIKQLRVSNAVLLGEIGMFERFMERLDPEELLGPQESKHQKPQLQTGRRSSREPQCLTADGMLTFGQKLDIAQREIKEIQQEKEKLKQKFDRITESRKASLMEADFRQTEIRKAKGQFERNSFNFMGCNQLQKTDAEKLLRCIQNSSKMEMLNRNNMSLRLKVKKLVQQLKEKKEKHEKADLEVHLMDQEGATVEKTFTEMKRTCFEEQQDISSHMEKVRRLTVESSELDDNILKRNQLLVHLEEEMQHAEKERLKAESRQQCLRRQVEDYQVPDVSEYMLAKAKLKKLQTSVHSMQRKVAVAQRSLQTCTREWIKQGDALKAAAAAGHNFQENPMKLPRIPEHHF